MIVHPTPLRGVILVDTCPSIDHRGALSRFYCEHELSTLMGARRIVQINHTRTVLVGAVRGLHFQNPPHAEMKFVRCLKGRVWDVAVDLRAGSPTFLQWHAEELSAGNARMQVISEGCAHAFQVLEEESELLYLHTAPYSPASEGGVRHDDPRVAISWPLEVADVSDRDRRHPLLADTYSGITV